MAQAKWYGNVTLKAFNKEINFLSDTVKIMLTTNGYVPDQDNHIYKSSVTNEVANGGGYTTGGKTLQNKQLIYTGATNVAKFDADDVSWTSSIITARIAVIYVDTGNPATSPLLGYIDMVTDQSSTGGNFDVVFDPQGIFTGTAG